MNYIERITPPALRPVSTQLLKEALRIDTTAEDNVLEIYLDSAITACENKLQTAIMSTTFRMYAPYFTQHMSLQKKWVTEIVSVSYYDGDGELQTLASGTYEVQTFRVPNVLYFEDDSVLPSTLFDTEFPVIIEFKAGFEAATGVPATIRNAVMIEAGDRYEHRQDNVVGTTVAIVNKTAEMLLMEEALWL